MTELGKSLVFYLKYFPEMQRLYEDGAFPELDGRPDRGDVMKKVDAVGDSACREAAALLKACSLEWLAEIESAEDADFSSPRWSAVERSWQLRVDVRPARSKKAAGINRQVGLYLERDAVVPWVWMRGGLAAEPRLRKLLSGVETHGSKKFGWSGGSVALAPTEIPWRTAKDFTVDAAPIIERTRKTFKAISPAFIRKFLAD